MPNAQDHAFAQLARQRGLLGPDQLRQVEALRATLPHDEPLAQLTLKGKVLPPAAVAGLLRDLARGAFACERCPERVPYDALSRLERLACPRCGAGLHHRADPSDGAVIQSHDSGRFPARPATGGTGAFPATQRSGTGAFPAARPSTGAHAIPGGPAAGAYPAAGPRQTGAFSAQRLRPSDGASLQPPATPGGPPPAAPPPAVPAVWDAEATVVDRARRSTGARAVVSLGATAAGGAGTTGARLAAVQPQQPPLLPGEETVREAPTAPLKPPPNMPPIPATVDSTRVERIEPIPIPGTNEAVRSIGPYQLISEIGRGQGGVIYLARKQGLERRYAVKVLLGDDLADEEAVKRFQLEAAVASKLDDPGIVGVFDTGRVAGKWYYAMEYIPGETLERRLARGPLGPPEASRLVSQLARTVHKAHAQGVVHRDLKPANIIIEETTGRPKITDFGVARDRTLLRSVTVSGELLGTPAYMAPEQLKGERSIDHRVDIYALGVILFEAVAGRRPFDAATTILLAEKVVHEDAPLLSSAFPSAPPALVDACARALARDRGARYDSARDLADDLDRALRSPRSRSRGGAGSGRWTTVVAAVATALATVAVGTAILLGTHPPGPPPVDPAAEAARLAAERSARLTVATQALESAETRLDQAARPEPAELQTIAESVDAAATVVADDPVLAPRAAALRRRAKVELALARARDLSRTQAPTDEVLAALRAAVEAAGTERALNVRARLARAELLRRRCRQKDALAEAEGLSSADGAVGLQARAIAACVQLDSQGPARARAALQALAEDDPKGVAGLVARSYVASIDGEHEAAASIAQRAREADPSFPLAHLRAARALLALRRSPDAAREAVEAALQLAPDDARAILTRVELEPATGRDKVMADLDLAVRLTAPETDPAVLLERARSLAGLQRLPQALADLDELIEREPDHFTAIFLRGLVHEAMSPGSRSAVDDWRRARALDEGAFDRATDNLQDREMRKRVREALGIADVSAPTIRVGQVSPETERLLQARAAKAAAPAREPLQEALLRAARAEPWRTLELLYDRADRAAPGDPAVALERLRVTVGRDAYAAAAAALEKARGAGAAPAEVDRLGAELALRQDHRTEADKALRDLARRDADGVEGRCALAEAELLRARLEPALAAADAALTLDADHTGALTVKALVLIELGQDRKAFELIARILGRQGALDARPLLARYVAMCKAVLGEAERRGGGMDQRDLAPIVMELQSYMRTSEGAAGCIVSASMALHVQGAGVLDFGKRMLMQARQREPERPDLLLVLGRYAVVDARDADLAIGMWRRARELEPLFVITEDARREYTALFGQSSEVDALAARR